MGNYKRLFSLISLLLFVFLAFSFSGELSVGELQKFSPPLRLLLKKPETQRGAYQKIYDLTAKPGQTEFNVLIKFSGDPSALQISGVKIYTSIGPIATARATQSGLMALAKLPSVKWIEISQYDKATLDVSRKAIGAAGVHDDNPMYRGKGSIVGFFDSGIDWRHEDFIDNHGRSRILYLFDMTDSTGPHPAGLDYGTEYTQAQLNDELDGTPTGLVREKDSNGHGTHVAGTAAGDGSATGNGEPAKTYIGIAPQADFIIVKGGDGSFSRTNQINGLSYMLKKAEELGRPIAINYSIGGVEGAHDGTSLVEQAYDAAAGPGRAIVVAAGNEATDNNHASGTVNSGNSEVIDVKVAEGAKDFWVDIWHEGSDRMAITVTTPDGYTTPSITSGSQENWTHWDTNAGRIEVIAPAKNPNNNDYELEVWVDNEGGTEVKPGDWQITLSGISMINGRFDAWTNAEFTSHIDNTMKVTIPGTADKVLTVASYVSKTEWQSINGSTYTSYETLWNISSFSSPGPTRDGRLKPDVAAPGDRIASALSQDSQKKESNIVPDGVHVISQGTSMAAPHVTGAVALLFEKNPWLTSDEIKQTLINSADVDQYTGSVWNRQWGHVGLNVQNALQIMAGSTKGNSQRHDVGNVLCNITDWGTVAAPTKDQPGFNFPAGDNQDHSAGGTFIVGLSGKDMADSYGDRGISEDDFWRTSSTGQIRLSTPGLRSDQDGYAQFEKNLLTPNGLSHITVTQHSYAWKSEDFVLIDYEVRNNSSHLLENLLLGFLMDWDVMPDYKANVASYNARLQLAYMRDATSAAGPYLGCLVLSPQPHSVDIINNKELIYADNDLDDQAMFELMQTPGVTGATAPEDLSLLLSATPLTLPPGQTRRFAIALVAGYDQNHLQQTAQFAQLKYQTLGRSLSDVFYDDGTAEGKVFMTVAGEKLAVQITPPSYPATLHSAYFYTHDASAGVKLNVYNANGPAGTPGAALLPQSVYVTPQENSWNTVDLSSYGIRLSSGEVYISLEWIVPEHPQLGYDDEIPYAGRSWSFENGRWLSWLQFGEPWSKRDVMIGAGFDVTTSVVQPGEASLPQEFGLSQNYPNPFNPETRFSFSLTMSSHVKIGIYDILGRNVRALIDHTYAPGVYQVQWDGKDGSGNAVTSGVYFYRLSSQEGIITKKMTLLR